MICAEAKELLQSHADGELAGPKLMEIEEHVGSCQTCGAAASRLKKNTAFLIARLELLRGKVDVDLSFLETAAAEKAKKAAPAAAEKAPARRFPWYVPVAAVVVLAGVGWWFLRGGGEPEGRAGGGEAARVGRGEEDVPAGTGSRRPAEVPPGSEAKKPDREPFRPVPVRANVALLFPELLRTPTQLRLEKVWDASAKEEGVARRFLTALDATEAEKERVVLTLTLAGVLDDPAARERLGSLLRNDGSARVRAAAAAALGRVPGGKTRISLAGGFGTRGGVIEDEERRRLLLDAASSERDADVLAVLIHAIGPSQAADSSITPRLLELTSFDEPRIQRAALHSLSHAKFESVRDVMFLVEDSRLPVEARSRLVDMVPRTDREEGTRALIGYLESTDEDDMKVVVLATLARNPTDEAVAAATRILRSEAESPVRLGALALVAAKPSADAKKLVKELAKGDEDQAVRAAAKAALTAWPTVEKEGGDD